MGGHRTSKPGGGCCAMFPVIAFVLACVLACTHVMGASYEMPRSSTADLSTATGTLNLATQVTGVLPAANGGTASTSLPIKVLVKTSNQSLGTGAAFVDDADLQFAIGANETWVGYMHVPAISRSGSQNTPNFKVSTGVASSTFYGAIFTDGTSGISGTSQNLALDHGISGTGTGSSSFVMYASTAGSTGRIKILLYVKNGASAGTFKVQWNPNSQGATINAGTYLVLHRQ